MTNEISNCRICGSTNLTSVFNMGNLAHAGVFNRDGEVPEDPIEIVVCSDKQGCGLVQLKHEFDPDIMYGDHYGYRSSLNLMMVDHLNELASSVMKFGNYTDSKEVNVLDIGSNDGTLLGHFKKRLSSTTNLFGIDPSSTKFSKYYAEGICTSCEFFSAEEYFKMSDGKKADIVTSIAMFYDLPKPQEIVDDISKILSDDGSWVVEQSYLPLMLGSNSFDTICHEHTEYYGLEQFMWMCERSDLKVIDMELNSSNGGSFRLYIKKSSANETPRERVKQFQYVEKLISNDWIRQIDEFSSRVNDQRNELMKFLKDMKEKQKKICGLGASTKGNILLQYYGLDTELIWAIAEVNQDKIGMRTPRSGIPIIDQDEALDQFDYFLVLPWHFKENFLRNSKFKGKKLIFPLPHFEILTA